MIALPTLGLRLAAWTFAVTAALGVLLTLYYQRQTHDLLNRESEERLSTLARHVAAASVLGTLARSEELLRGAIDGAMSHADVEAVAIYDEAGRAIAWSSRGSGGAPPLDPEATRCRPCALGAGSLRWAEPVASAHGGSTAGNGEDAGPFEGPPRPAGEARLGWLVLDVSTAARVAAERRISARGLLMAAGILALSLAVAFFVAQRLTSPLRALAQATREIGKGRWDVPLPSATSREVAQLSADFGAMAAALAALDRENTSYREHLEEMVATRTGELAAAYENLKAMAEAKDQFVATVSHDFRSPLAMILSAVQTMQADTAMPGDIRGQFLARAERQCKRLGVLVNDLLDLARIENREEVFERAPVEAVLSECVEGIRGAIDERGVSLVWAPPREPVIADMDRALLARAVTNLLDNAVKFSPPSGRVAVELRRDGDEARIAVTDSGPGIPEDEREHVFERFFQGREGRALGRGSGLGLAIVAGVARRHGGAAAVTGSGPGGTTFEVRFPLTRG